MPGHKRNSDVTQANLPYGIDITEIEGFDNLHHAEEIIREAGSQGSVHVSCRGDALFD